MPNETHHLDIALLGELRVACPPEDRDALLAAVAYVDEKMKDIAGKTKSNISERIAVMAALNIAHEYLSHKPAANETLPVSAPETGLDFGAIMRRFSDMEANLEAVLAPQEKLL